jgi:hypothetical protein
MTYSSKEECYRDVYASLSLGLLDEDEIRHLLDYYKDIEYYECCQGIVEAYADFKGKKQIQ